MTNNILVLDNYDSFTYNLVHAIEKITGQQVTVFRNDEISIAEVEAFDKIILSPGPGLPANAGIMPELLKTYAPTKSILGVCLGHQAITECFGGSLFNLAQVYHGVAMPITVLKNDSVLFKGLPAQFDVGRYHSWIADSATFPDVLEITAVDEFNNIMALQHKEYDVQGVQFHPESVLTPLGEKILENWIKTF